MTLQFNKPILAVAILAVSAACATVTADSSNESSHTAATELQWMDSGFGPQVSPIDGDFSKEGHVTYIRFSGGLATPLHTHSHDYVGIVLTGVTRHWEPGKPETKKQLSAGAHWFMPADVPHISECLTGAECIMALYQQDAMDFLPVE